MTTALSTETRSGATFDEFAALVRAQFTDTLAHYGPHLFTVTPDTDIYEAWLDMLPQTERQHHTCHACREFIRHYGTLAAITPTGELVPAVWPNNPVPAPYDTACAALRRAVARGSVTGVALPTASVLGVPVTGAWTHLAVELPAELCYRPTVLSANQAEAAKREDHRTLSQGLAEFSPQIVAQALTLLEADTLYRSEKVLGPARFLAGLHAALAGKHGRQRDAIIWRAVAGAPPGFCQPRSTMVGTLLEDIAAELDFEMIQRRFAAKLRPLQYQRPQAAPASGNIAQAEKVVEQLGIERSLERRFARLEEIPTLWQPPAHTEPAAAGGLFGHLRAKGAASISPLTVPPQTITWEKFARTVLPSATQIAVLVSGAMNFCGIVTAVHADAPPILQWDTAEQRNPVSWYVYNGGSPPERWGLRSATWVPVTAVTLQPSLWTNPERYVHHGKNAIFVLEGARDTGMPNLALFPETLRSELHGVRAVIEAYSHTRHLEGAEEASANGLRVGQQNTANQIRVTNAAGTIVYHIDRWD